MSIFYDKTPYSVKENIAKVVDICKLKEGDVFIDCGSNRGQEIEQFSSLNIVFDSYEPHPYFFNILKEKFKDYKNVTLNNKAVWIDNSSLTFYFKKPEKDWGGNHRSGGASLIKKTNHRGGSQKVDCVDIVDIINKHEKIKVLKIDIEGAEYKVIRRLIEKELIFKPEYIFFEDHEVKIQKSDRDMYIKDKKFVQEFVNNNKFKFYNW